MNAHNIMSAISSRRSKRILDPRQLRAVILAAVALIVLATVLFPPATAQAADPVPKRVIADPNPYFSGVWVDTVNDELVVSDENEHRILVYQREASGAAPPLREIGGEETQLSTVSSVVVDLQNNEIWAVDNDTHDRALVFSRTANGDVAPSRAILFSGPNLQRRAWGWAVDEVHNEVAGTFEEVSTVHIFDRATGALLRSVRGPSTGLADPHGIFIDTENDEIYVVNVGFLPNVPKQPASITVYSRTASGDATPVRTIQGPLTLLDIPMGIFVDTENDEIAVANNNNTVVVFEREADGNVPPKRVISGPQDLTGLDHPTGVFIDTEHDELVVTNWGNHTITVYERDAEGNAAPLRTITTSPGGPSVGVLHPGALSLDLVHNEFAITNCVSHPRISVFSRLANGQVVPLRVIEGPNAEFSRSGHGIVVDTVNDEIVVPSQEMQAIIVFNRSDAGNIPPKRRIQGPQTLLAKPQGVHVDTVNDEIIVPNETSSSVTVHDRRAAGNVPPLRQVTSTPLKKPKAVWVDNVNDELYVVDSSTAPKILVFARSANGPSMPLRVISGTLTMLTDPRQLVVDAVNNEITVADEGSEGGITHGFVAVFDRLANGNVPPKRFIQHVVNSHIVHPRALFVDAVNNEIGVGDEEENAISIFERVFP